MKRVIVASTNPVKIKAVQHAFERMFAGESFVVEGKSVLSGVKDQPTSHQETFTGARNRATLAMQSFPEAHYWVGLEGGVEKTQQGMEQSAWVVVLSTSKMGKARTGTYYLPPKVAQLIEEGKELGEADDIVFGRANSKQQNGSVGILTHNVFDRTTFYSDGLVLALIPFKNEHLY